VPTDPGLIPAVKTRGETAESASVPYLVDAWQGVGEPAHWQSPPQPSSSTVAR